MSLLSAIIFSPLVGAIGILFLPQRKKNAVRIIALLFSALSLLLTCGVLFHFNPDMPGMQFVERMWWIPSFGIQYVVGIDGMSVILLILSAFLSVVAVISSFAVEERIKEYFFFFLLLETGLYGVFCALDFFLLYVFWNVNLVSIYFLIGIGGGARREFAALKFFLFAFCGSAALLLGMLGMYFFSEPHTFDLLILSQKALQFQGFEAVIIFCAIYGGCAVIIPAFPFHTWLPLAHREAPIAVSIMMVGVFVKMGIYVILRVGYGILPHIAQHFSSILVIIALFNIVYGALVGLAQKNLKDIAAYATFVHMGYCMLGIASLSVAGFNGAVFHLFNHGIFIAAFLLLIGVLYERTHTLRIEDFGGIRIRVPIIAGFMTVVILSAIGMPGLSVFISEFLCFLGVFPIYTFAAVVGVLGILITATFFLRMLERVFWGSLNPRWITLPDIRVKELYTLTPLILALVVLGLYPKLVLHILNQSMVYLQGLIR